MNADETWKASEPNNFGIINFRTRYSGNIGGYKNVLNSHFKMSNEIHADTKSENILITNSGTLYFRISETRCKTVEELKIWLQQNPLKMVQVRKEPVIEPFPEDFKQALKNLSTYYPTTVISVGDGEMYGDVELTYIADTKNYIDNQIKAVTGKQIETNKLILERMI